MPILHTLPIKIPKHFSVCLVKKAEGNFRQWLGLVGSPCRLDIQIYLISDLIINLSMLLISCGLLSSMYGGLRKNQILDLSIGEINTNNVTVYLHLGVSSMAM